MKKTATFAFLVLWTAALAFPQVARCLLARAGVVSYAPFPSLAENRLPAPRPSLRRSSPNRVAPRDLGRGLEKWYNDAFPWRTELLAFHRRVSFDLLKTPVGREVPGYGNWVFRRGGDWAELDDYLGAFELTEDELADWVALFEGRREWARAMGTVFLTVPAPVKAQVRWQEMYPAIRRHRGRNVSAQVREALSSSPARDDVLFAGDDFKAAFAGGREVFFDSDHHPSAYGLWLLYDRLNRRLAELFPDRAGKPCPWYDDPPEEVRLGKAPGCWPDREGNPGDAAAGVRLDVSSPGEKVVGQPPAAGSRRYPFCGIETRRAGGGLSVLMAHDSYMRFSLASWRRDREDVRFPFVSGVGSVRALIFQRISQRFIEHMVADAVPDVIVEQFPECRLDGSADKYLDDNLRAAAAFGRAREPSPDGRLPSAGARVAVRAVFQDVRAEGRAKPVAVLLVGGREAGRRNVLPGTRRAVFFDPVDCPAGAVPSVRLLRGHAAASEVAWRIR